MCLTEVVDDLVVVVDKFRDLEREYSVFLYFIHLCSCSKSTLSGIITACKISCCRVCALGKASAIASMTTIHPFFSQNLVYATDFTYSNHRPRAHEGSGFIVYVSGCNVLETWRLLGGLSRRDIQV